MPQPIDLQELLRERVTNCGHQQAYVFLGQDLEVAHELTYETLGQAAKTIAAQLRSHTQPGDRVLLAFENDLEAVQLFWGCILAGVIPVPAPAPDARSAQTSEGRLRAIAFDAGVALAMTHEARVETGRALIPDLPWCSLATLRSNSPAFPPASSTNNPEGKTDIAYLQYTSGSTSTPRGVAITHENMLAQCRALMNGADTLHTRGLVWLPWFHDYGLVHGVIQPLYSGGTAFLMSTTQFQLRPLRWLEAIEKHRVTHSGAPNFAYAACVRALARANGWSAQLATWRLATCGAEPVRAATLNAFAKAFAPYGFDSAALAPSYGLAEAVLAVTVRDTRKPMIQLTLDGGAIERHEVQPAPPDTPGARTLVGCGPALPGFDLRIVDPETSGLCGPDRIGEIWVAGPSVSPGYWGQPEASAEHFGHILGTPPADSAKYLRTGDLGFLYGGELFVAGRCKDLIIANGRNLYPQDLEQTAEAAHANVRIGGAIAISVDNGASESVVLLLECSRRPTPAVVRQLVDSVQKRVAIEHQIDLHDVVPLRTGTLPRTSSGKPQRSAARRLHLQGRLEPLRMAARSPALLATSSAQEPDAALIDTLTLLWCEVLGLDSIEADANFFDLGGDSLLATQLASRVRTRLGIELPISALFEAPTVRGFAQRVVQTPAMPPSPQVIDGMPQNHVVPHPRESESPVDLSFSQERMWFMHELAPESSAYNIPLALRLQGPLDMAAMQTALAQVVARHEVLRTRFTRNNNGVFGEVLPTTVSPIEEVRLTLERDTESDHVLHRHLAKVTCEPFHLDQCPLFRVQVIRLAEEDAVLLIVMHHIISDQWSFTEMGRELAAHYSAVQTGIDACLPSLPIQYADYASWHRSNFEGAQRANELAYWTRRLDGVEPLPLNNDFPRAKTQSSRGASLRLPLAPDHIVALRSLGAAHGASLSMVLITALNVMLLRHTGKTDIAIGVPIANRHHLASENLIGTFVNTLVFRTALDGDPDFRTVLSRVREVSLEAFAHQDMPFELLVRELASRRDNGRQPLFNVMFNMVNSRARDCLFEGLTWSRLYFDRASTQFDLAFVADLLYDNALVIEYSTDLFVPETVQRMGEHLQNILTAAVEAPESRVSEIPLMGETERATLNRWSIGPTESPLARTVADWIGCAWRPFAHEVAVVFGTAQMTHKEVDEASNRLARFLRQRGIARGARVGVCLPRSHDLVIALLAILKTGAAYVPLDPDYPSHRLNHQIEDADLALLLTQSTIALVCDRCPRLQLDIERASIASTAPGPLAADPDRDARPEDPAYVIYTSGSTGRPKGVAVPHRAVVNLLTSMARAPGLTARDRLLAVTTPSFDIAALELFLPLGVGGTVVIASETQASDGRLLAEVIAREKITVLQSTPSRWHMLIDSGWAGDQRLKALVGGEPLTPSLASVLLSHCAEVWNMYGPTETTVWSSCCRVSLDSVQAIDLGRPVMNTSIQVLDDHLQPCPIGVPGEIYIGGTGVALGYYKREALTAERFIEQPAARISENTRIYRTGDRGRWRHDGTLEHGGRLDEQVKLRGFRMELGEIESNLLNHTAVARAVVTLREDLPGQARLVAYVVPDGAMPSSQEMREHLRHWLPDHMVPSVFVELSTIPLLPNGKTNRQALPVPPIGHKGSNAPPTGPRNTIEETILAIWREVLHNDELGIHDHFFEHGGHSILAVRVVSRIESELRLPCALAQLFEHPTVAGLAATLTQAQSQDAADVPIAVLQPDGVGPGLFLLAGANMYRHLATRLDAQIPVYGVFSQTEIDILQRPEDIAASSVSVDALAIEYLTLIRAIQPHGPYYLGGFSIGGVLAYEVAKHLREAGEEIGLIILLDSMLPGRTFKHVLTGLRRRLRLFRKQGLKHLLHIYRVYSHQSALRHQPGSRRNQTYARILRAHHPVPCDLPALFLQASDDAATTLAYGWKTLVPGMSVEFVPGQHMDIMEPPNVDVLADCIRTHIATAKSATALAASPVPAAPAHNVSGFPNCS